MQKFKHILIVLLLCTISNFSFSQLSGIYRIGTTPISGENGFYPTLAAAITALNTSGVNGPCTFYFSDNGATYTEAADIAIGYLGGSSTNTVTIKPYTGVSCQVNFTNNATRTIDGSLVIGAADASAALPGSLISTNYLSIDGSNTDGGTTRDLTISNSGISVQKSLIRIFGNNDNIVIKNCILTSSSTSTATNAAVNITNYFSSPTNFNPDNITIQNNLITANSGTNSAGIHSANSGNPTIGANNLTIRDNTINANLRGIFVSYTVGGNIFNNTISVVSTGTTTNITAYGITVQTNFTAGTFNIYNNNLINLTTNTTAAAGASNGIIGIDNQCVTPKVVNIYNNVIRGFAIAGSSPNNARIYGIRNTSTSTSSIYNNSILLPELNNIANPNNIGGIAFASAATTEVSPAAAANCVVRNNVILIEESTMKVWAIRRVGANGTFVCDNNILYVNPLNASGNIGFINGIDEPSFSGWQTTSGHDANSFNINPNFTSTTNLMPTLAGYLPGSNTLFSITDINGVTRSTTKPHIGAYESTAKHWLGTTSDWNSAPNWRDDVIPSSGDQVIIGYNSSNPNLPSDITVGNIGLQENVKLVLGSNAFTINGAINGTGTLTGSSSSNLTLGGAAGTVNFTSGARTLKDLTLTVSGSATLGTPLEITAGSTAGTVTVAGALTTGGNLVLKSDASGTARIANSAGTISGNVTTETHIPGGRRAFRFLGHPFTSAQAMSSLMDDIFVTGGNYLTGFDSTGTQSPSSYWFNDASNTWAAFTSTSDASWAQHRGARVLVRGDRTQAAALTGATYTPNEVTLDMTGAVNTGNQTINLTNANNYHLVSNPYPSPTDIGTVIQGTSNIGTLYWVWNANAGTRGQYVNKLVADGAYNLAMNGAFFVLPTASTSLVFTEAHKTSTASQALFRQSSTNRQGYLELVLKQNNEVQDNIFIRNLSSASSIKDVNDGVKLTNPDFNIYTLTANSEQLTLDSRPISSTTVIPIGVTSPTSNSFSIAIADNGLNNGLPVVLKDKYLNVEHVLTANSPYNFTVTNDAASQGNDRFELVFRTAAALPTTFVNVAAQQKGSAIEVNFTTANESNMHSYEVEESKDGTSFTKGTTLEAKNAANNTYNWVDPNIHNGNNYYRVKAIEKNGTIKYSQVVRVNVGKQTADFTVYPNPVKGGLVNLQLTDVEKGVYTVRIVNNLGQELAAKTINHNGGSANQTISLGNVPTGKYNMVITIGTSTVTKTMIVE